MTRPERLAAEVESQRVHVLDDTSVLVQVDTNTKLRVDKNAIASVGVKETKSE